MPERRSCLVHLGDHPKMPCTRCARGLNSLLHHPRMWICSKVFATVPDLKIEFGGKAETLELLPAMLVIVTANEKLIGDVTHLDPVLHCTLLYCTLLCCTVLCSSVLC